MSKLRTVGGVYTNTIENRMLYLDYGLHVLLDELFFDNFDDALLGRLLEVMLGAVTLFDYACLHFLNVDRGRILSQELLTLELVEFGRLDQEGPLEVLFVDGAAIDTQNHQHLARCFY